MHIPFASTGSYPVRTGNHVRPLIDGEPAFRRICKAVDAQEGIGAFIDKREPKWQVKIVPDRT